MTINQTLDEIFVSYQNKDLSKYPAVKKLKDSLIELKIHWGGNTPVANKSTVKNVIKSGSANPEDWN